jgi:hypothetical protein
MADIELQGGLNYRRKRAISSGLGNVQLRDPTTNELILIPRPSGDPEDPLNWYGDIAWTPLCFTNGGKFLSGGEASGFSLYLSQSTPFFSLNFFRPVQVPI